MCGIAGVVGEVGEPERSLVRTMCAAMRHRGPDAEGYLDKAGVCLGMRRLAIIDVAKGAQPVHSEDGRVAGVFNGEIYNFRDLQERLRRSGHRLISDSDSECLPHLYEESGARMLQDLRGMFAFALWDAREQQLLIARDRVGKKPLYYWEDCGRLWFASELKCLLSLPGLARVVDEQALSHYLTYQYVPAPWSIVRGVKKLPPAHFLTWRNGESLVESYWQLNYGSRRQRPLADPDLLAAELRERLLEATNVRMISERPLGAFLSGGLDSSAVVAAMARVSSAQVSTFSVGFEDEDFNELPYAKQVADLYGTEHHELVVQPDIAGILPRIAGMFDEPFADSSAVPSYYVAEAARKEVVVVLNGDGGDEAFGGYSRYARFARAGIETELPRALASSATAAAHAVHRHSGAAPWLQRGASVAMRAIGRDAPERYGRMVSYFTTEEKRRVLRTEVLRSLESLDSYWIMGDAWATAGDSDVVNHLLAADLQTYLPGDLLPKVDITTMAVSLEARSPLLDHPLLEWAARLPGDLKVKNGETKVLFKKAMEPWLPAALINRPKQGFAIPLASWLQNDLRDMVADLLFDPQARCLDFLDGGEVRRIVQAQQVRGVDSEKVWSLLMLELSLREVLKPR